MFKRDLPRFRTYAEANDFLKGLATRSLAPNCFMVRHLAYLPDGSRGYVIDIQLHSTYIVTYFPTGEVRLRSADFYTRMTKHYLNRVSPYNVWSEKGVWWVRPAPLSSRLPVPDAVPFEDGMVSRQDGSFPTEVEIRAEAARREMWEAEHVQMGF